MSVHDQSAAELYDAAPCALFTMTLDAVMLSVNDTFVTWTGRSREELIGTSLPELLTPASRIFFETRFQPVLGLQSEVREVSLSLALPSGDQLPVLLNSRRMMRSDGRGELIQSAMFAATERLDFERQLLLARRSAESAATLLRTLNTAATAFMEAVTESDLGRSLATIAREAFQAADVAVALYNTDGGFRVVAGEHLTAELSQLWIARPSEDLLDGSRVVTFETLSELEEVAPSAVPVLRGLRMQALSVVGLRGENGPLGVIALFYGRERSFDDDALSLHAALAGQASLVLDRLRLQTELEMLALHDQLTGLANRNLLRERLSHALAAGERTGRSMALIFLDLDGFKPVNDELGHRAGDAVLQSMARRINGVVRESDVVGRFGGDEFLVICEEADEDGALHGALHVALRIAEAVAAPLSEELGMRTLTASIGIAVHDPALSVTPTNDMIVRAADAAMYEAKNEGASRIVIRAI